MIFNLQELTQVLYIQTQELIHFTLIVLLKLTYLKMNINIGKKISRQYDVI